MTNGMTVVLVLDPLRPGSANLCRCRPTQLPLLFTFSSSNAALVAIGGGLLVVRFVILDSEQQGTQHVLDDAEARLTLARQQKRSQLLSGYTRSISLWVWPSIPASR